MLTADLIADCTVCKLGRWCVQPADCVPCRTERLHKHCVPCLSEWLLLHRVPCLSEWLLLHCVPCLTEWLLQHRVPCLTRQGDSVNDLERVRLLGCCKQMRRHDKECCADLLKYDNCATPSQATSAVQQRYTAMRCAPLFLILLRASDQIPSLQETVPLRARPQVRCSSATQPCGALLSLSHPTTAIVWQLQCM